MQPHQDPRSLQTLRVSRHESETDCRRRIYGSTAAKMNENYQRRPPATREQEIDNRFTSRRSLHNQKKVCASCGYPAAKTRKCTLDSLSSSRGRLPKGFPRILGASVRMLTTGCAIQTTSLRRPSAERPPALVASVTSAPSLASSRTASRPVSPRAPRVPSLLKRANWVGFSVLSGRLT